MKIYNTLSGEKEDFLPQGDPVKMYVCGVTPYAEAHIGHAMSYIIFDVIRRYLEFSGYRVKYVQNITDIDDKIIDRANKLGISTVELAKKYTDSFFSDMGALNVDRADIYPRATEEIPKIIEVVAGLVDKGYAYPAKGSVYFRVRKVAGYGKLARRDLESMMSADSTVGSDDKESPMDFVLWKAGKPGEPLWESPWGRGRPGWHIECSAMSLKYLGNTIDIHGGGQDLIFPHHENEIAQSESFSGKKPFVKYWLHNGLLQFGEEKMSKSLGNLITIKEALERYSADAIRIFVLGSNYRSPLTYSEEALEAAESGADRLRRVISRDGPTSGGVGEALDAEPYRKQFIKAMDDDFNTAQALAVLFDLAREINQANETGYSVTTAQKVLLELAGVLGLTLKTIEKPYTVSFANSLTSSWKNIKIPIVEARGINDSISLAIDEVDRTSEYIHERIKSIPVGPGKPDLSEAITANIDAQEYLRDQLRQAKQYQLADEIRSRLDELGIALEDTHGGTVWKHKR